MGDIEAEHVKAVVDGLDLPDLGVPIPKVVSSVGQESTALILSLV